jgi:hypothetical protein
VNAVATDFDINCRREESPSSLTSSTLLLFDDDDARSVVALDCVVVAVNPSQHDANNKTDDEHKRDEVFMIE